MSWIEHTRRDTTTGLTCIAKVGSYLVSTLDYHTHLVVGWGDVDDAAEWGERRD